MPLPSTCLDQTRLGRLPRLARCSVHATVTTTMRHDTTRQDTTGHDTTRQDTTGHDRTRQDTTGYDRTPQDTTGHHRTRQDTTGHDRTRQDTTGHDTTATNSRRTRHMSTCRRWGGHSSTIPSGRTRARLLTESRRVSACTPQQCTRAYAQDNVRCQQCQHLQRAHCGVVSTTDSQPPHTPPDTYTYTSGGALWSGRGRR
jgi:hypothetical protein